MRTSWARLCCTGFMTLLMAAACSGGESGAGGASPASETGESGASPTVATETDPSPFLLDLETGEETPLPESLSGGLAYVASPNGTRIAYANCPGGVCPATGVMTVANIDGTGLRTFEAPEGQDYVGFWWSPDGTKLLYQLYADHDPGNLFLHDLATDRRTKLTDLELDYVSWQQLHMSFSPDGRNVIFHLPRSGSEITKWDVWSVPVIGGEPTLMLRNAAFPSYFPDGKHIAFVVPGTSAFDGHIIAIADEEGSRRTLVEVEPGYRWPSVSPDGSRIAYQVDGSIYVVDVSTGGATAVGAEGYPEWLDGDTLIVSP